MKCKKQFSGVWCVCVVCGVWVVVVCGCVCVWVCLYVVCVCVWCGVFGVVCVVSVCVWCVYVCGCVYVCVCGGCVFGPAVQVRNNVSVCLSVASAEERSPAVEVMLQSTGTDFVM